MLALGYGSHVRDASEHKRDACARGCRSTSDMLAIELNDKRDACARLRDACAEGNLNSSTSSSRDIDGVYQKGTQARYLR
ncbi:MAG: hypothetical protein R2753_17735 [Chitinophagales bacterium]